MSDNKTALVQAALHRWRKNGFNAPATRSMVRQQYGVEIEELDDGTLKRMAGTCWDGEHACVGAGQTPRDLANVQANKQIKAQSAQAKANDMLR